MQSRKKQNLEVERKIKRQKKMYAGVFAAICLAVVIVVGWVVWDTQNRRFIMTFEGERIETGDFLFMRQLMGVEHINDITRHDILNELLTFLTVMEMGERYGVGFTPEEREENESSARFLRGQVEFENQGTLGFISDRRIGEFLGLFEQVGMRLVDLLIDYVPDEEEFEEELEMQIEWLIEQGTEVLVKYMAVENREDFNEAALELTSDDGFDFDDIARRTCVLQTGLEPINLFEFAFEYGVEVDDWLAGLPIGQFSPTLGGFEYYFIFYVYDHVPPELDLEEVRSEFRENFILNRSMMVFFEKLEGWVSEAEYELNHRVFDTIT